MHLKLLFFILALLFSFNSAVLPQQVQAMPKASTPADLPTSTGTIIETMNASGYTYMLIESGAEKTWVAVPETVVEKGTTVKYCQGMVMNNFTSKTLNRTFEAIVFSPGLADEKPEDARQAAPDDSFTAAITAEKAAVKPDTPMEMSAGSTGAIVPLEEISIEKPKSANGYSVKEIFEKTNQLAGKKVQVHGKVVKFSPMIMGKNWIHLQDGTGNPMQNSHDLVITTIETIEVDKIVTIEGTLAAEKDFGAGYKYAAIIEDASIVK
jgi:hypothetical protein